MTVAELKQIQTVWANAKTFLEITSDEQHDQALDLIDTLMAVVPDSEEDHPMQGLLQTLGTLITDFENQHVPIPSVPPHEALKYLMEEHGLKQSDLKEIGSQGVVSEILSGKRKLNVRQIQYLCQRFHTSPNVFFSS